MLLRLLWDAQHQRRGHGRAFVEAVAQHVRAQHATALKVSAHEEDGEVVFTLPLLPDALASPRTATRSNPPG